MPCTARLYQHNSDEIIGMTFVGLEKSTINSIYVGNFMKNLIILIIIFALALLRQSPLSG